MMLFSKPIFVTSYHEIVHANVLFWARYENAQLPTAKHSQPIQTNHVRQTIPEIENENF